MTLEGVTRKYEVREGRRVAPTCKECGCRLQEIPWPNNHTDMYYPDGVYFLHFVGYLPFTIDHGDLYNGLMENKFTLKDAAGCECNLYVNELLQE